MKIQDICDINSKTISSRDEIEDILYLDTSNLTQNEISCLQPFHLSDAPSRAQRKVKHNTILYSSVRPNQKHYGILKNPDNRLIVSTGFICLDVKEDKTEEYDAQFLFYTLTQDWVTAYLQTIAENSVSSYPSIKPTDIGNLDFAFPAIEVQRKIASALQNMDDKIALNKSINQNLEALAKQLYDYWFVQFDFPDENGKPYKSSGGKMVWNETLKSEIPNGWNYLTLNKITKVITGKEDANFSVLNGSYPFFTCSKDNLRCNTPAFSGAAILIAGNGDFNVKHYTGEFNAYQRTYVLIPHEEKYFATLYFAALEKIDSFRAKSNGSIIKFITKGDIESIGVFDCPNNRFYYLLNALIKKIEGTSKEIEMLIKQRDELLPLLMNGQALINSDLSLD